MILRVNAINIQGAARDHSGDLVTPGGIMKRGGRFSGEVEFTGIPAYYLLVAEGMEGRSFCELAGSMGCALSGVVWLETPIGSWPSEIVRVMYSPGCDGLEPYEMHWDDGTDVFLSAEKLDFETCGACDEGFKLLGRPYIIDVNEDYDDDYVSLLQIDENDDWGLLFYDCGMLFLLLRKSQLLGRDWHRTVACLYSC